MATAQAQDTGKAPENQDSGAGGAGDSFDDVFDQLSAPEPATLPAGGDQGAKGAEGAPAADAGSTGQEGGLPDPADVAADGTVKGAEGAEGAKGAPAGATGASPPAGATGGADTGQQFLADLARVLQTPAAAPKTEEQPRPPAVTPWSTEQSALVVKAREEYPEVFEAMDLEMKRLGQIVVDHIFTTYNPVLAQMQGTVVNTANMTHEQQLLAAVPDYQEVVPKVLAWIDTRPAYLKTAYQQVAEKGSVADVVGLIDEYRGASGTAPAPKAVAPPPAGQGAKPPTAAATPTAANAAAAQRAKVAQGLAPVAAKRSGVQAEVIDSDDFGGAFDSFASSAGL